jgi:hypothetical protein
MYCGLEKIIIKERYYERKSKKYKKNFYHGELLSVGQLGVSRLQNRR